MSQTPNAVVVGHVNLPKPQQRPQHQQKRRRHEEPKTETSNMAMLQELQFLKRQIKALKENAAKDANVRAAAAKVVGAEKVTVDLLKGLEDALKA